MSDPARPLPPRYGDDRALEADGTPFERCVPLGRSTAFATLSVVKNLHAAGDAVCLCVTKSRQMGGNKPAAHFLSPSQAAELIKALQAALVVATRRP
jgi:hypothetical protein